MECPRCLNKNLSYFYKGSRGYYCRKCISFKRVLIDDSLEESDLDEIKDDAHDYLLNYPLTKMQRHISDRCKNLILRGDLVIEAVCGAGKTEIVVDTIAYFLKMKKKVCFTIPRRQVVLELKKRLETIFTKAKVIAICRGHTEILDGDLIICTTHQTYRFYRAFDLLIIDEPDAFPYKGNQVLKNIVKTSCRGNIIYLTATLDTYLKKRIKENSIFHLSLNRRPHNHDLIVPKLIYCNFISLIFKFIKHLNNKNQILVFVPTIRMCELIYRILRVFYRVGYCHSKLENKDEMIDNFKQKNLKILITTSILERGVTFKDIDVYVLFSNHPVFDFASLVQISGRVGRNFENPYGTCLFFVSEKSRVVDETVAYIRRVNK